MEGTIKKFLEELEKKKKGEFFIFYEEVPVKVIINVFEINFSKHQIEFEINPKIEAMISQEKELYAKFNDEVLLLKALIWNKEVLVTSFPSFAIEPKVRRNAVRVKISSKHPVILEIDSELCVNLRDISEEGFSFKLPQNIPFEMNKEYEGKLKINGKTFPIKFKPLYKIERPDNTYRYGCEITEANPAVKNEIAKYVVDRQRELAKILSTFAD